MYGPARVEAIGHYEGEGAAMIRAARIDDNHTAIVKALRKCGAAVQSLAAVGNGCPDLLVWFRGYHVMEIKDGQKRPSARELTPAQTKWHAAWPGDVAVVTSVDDALRVIGATA